MQLLRGAVSGAKFEYRNSNFEFQWRACYDMTPEFGTPSVGILAAMAANRVIGRDGAIPWHIPNDLKRFKRLTTGSAVIMGRRTHASIGRLLPDRENIVLTRDADAVRAGATRAEDLGAAVRAALERHGRAWLIGGEAIYREGLERDLVDELHLTRLDRAVEGDTHFPEWPADRFALAHRERFDEPEPHAYEVYKRR